MTTPIIQPRAGNSNQRVRIPNFGNDSVTPNLPSGVAVMGKSRTILPSNSTSLTREGLLATEIMRSPSAPSAL